MISTGDEAGTAGGGVVSNKIKGKAEFVNFSFDVQVRGQERRRAPRPDAPQRQEHAAVPRAAGARDRDASRVR